MPKMKFGDEEVFIDEPDDPAGQDNVGDVLPDELPKESEAGTEPEPKKPVKEGVEPVSPVKGAGDQKEKKPYTPEELETLLKEDKDVDTSRLSAEGKVLMKSFQRGTEKKYQTLAEQRKEIEQQKKEFEDQKKQSNDPRVILFQEYLKDPITTFNNINTEIEKLEAVEPTDPNYRVARNMIVKLTRLKDDFRETRQGMSERNANVGATVNVANAAIIHRIPDFETKADKLTEFAIEDLGMTLEDVRHLSDPAIHGERAVRLVLAINKLYDKAHLNDSAEKKVNRKAPSPLGRAGSGGSLESEKPEAPGDMKYPEYRKWREEQSKKEK